LDGLNWSFLTQFDKKGPFARANQQPSEAKGTVAKDDRGRMDSIIDWHENIIGVRSNARRARDMKIGSPVRKIIHEQ
jgi:hypothetical protein